MTKISVYRRFRRFFRRHLVDAHPEAFRWAPRLTCWLHHSRVPWVTTTAFIIEKLLIPAQLYETIPFGDGMQLRLRLRDMIQAWIFCFGAWEPTTARIVCEHVAPNSLMLDLGAHCGDLALLASRVAPGVEVYAFEPDPTSQADMRHNLELNQASNVHIVAAAVSDRAGTLPLYMDDESFGWPSHTLAVSAGIWEGPPIEVEVVTVDSVCAGAGKPVSVVKIDIEGAELPALRGAETILRRDRPALVLEAFPARMADFGYSPTDLHTYLGGFGYRCARIDDADGSLHPIDLEAKEGLCNWLALHVEKGGDRIPKPEGTSKK